MSFCSQKLNVTCIKRIRQRSAELTPKSGGRGLNLFMKQEIRENQRCLHQRNQRSNS
jgi:hypothetical protein